MKPIAGRPVFQSGRPNSDGMGGYFLLLSASQSFPNEVIWVSHNETWVITQGWTTFASFLEYQLAH